nr:uncharacterized protein LOC109150754 [Ipomoea trifida]
MDPDNTVTSMATLTLADLEDDDGSHWIGNVPIRTLEGESFKKRDLILKWISNDTDPEAISLDSAEFWIQVHGLLVGLRLEAVLQAIGGFVGNVTKIDGRNFDEMMRTFFRVRVAIDVLKPLKKVSNPESTLPTVLPPSVVCPSLSPSPLPIIPSPAHYVSKKMAILLFKIQNNIQFDFGEMIFRHIMGFRQGKGDKVLLPFSSLIYGILCKHGFQKHQHEEEMSISSKYTIDKRLFQRSHFYDYSTLRTVDVTEGIFVPTRPPRVSINIDVVRARVDSSQYILACLKSSVAQVEKMLLDDKELLHSLEAEEQAFAPTR